MQQIYTCLKVIFSQIQIQSETLSISQFQLCPSPRAIRAFTHVSRVGHFQFYRCPWVGNLPIPEMTPGHLTPLPFWSSTWQKTETWFLFWFRQCAVHTLRGRSRVWDQPGHLIKKFVSTREFVKLKPGIGSGWGWALLENIAVTVHWRVQGDLAINGTHKTWKYRSISYNIYGKRER